MKIAAFGMALALAGCAGSPARLAMMDDDVLVQQGPDVLCNAYAFNHKEKYLSALKGRLERNGRPLTARDEEILRGGRVVVGMRASLLPCVKHMTPGYYHVNVTATANGTQRQHVWTEGMYHTISMIVYTENGFVTAIQY